MKEMLLGNKWGVGSILIGLGGLVMAGFVDFADPTIQTFAGGAGIAAVMAGGALVAKKFVGGTVKRDGSAPEAPK